MLCSSLVKKKKINRTTAKKLPSKIKPGSKGLWFRLKSSSKLHPPSLLPPSNSESEAAAPVQSQLLQLQIYFTPANSGARENSRPGFYKAGKSGSPTGPRSPPAAPPGPNLPPPGAAGPKSASWESPLLPHPQEHTDPLQRTT